MSLNELQKKIKEIAIQNGASLVGFADLRNIEEIPWTSGISIAVNIPKEIIRSISNGPNLDYYNTYHELNAKLDNIVIKGADYLNSYGIRTLANSTNNVKKISENRTLIPHKTIAIHSGLGWIGKSALLITKQYGAAVRLSSILTDAEFQYYDKKTQKSYCGKCMKCTNACPGHAISGKLWEPGLDRDVFFHAKTCRKTANRLCEENLQKTFTICGKCIEICPYTQRYLKKSDQESTEQIK